MSKRQDFQTAIKANKKIKISWLAGANNITESLLCIPDRYGKLNKKSIENEHGLFEEPSYFYFCCDNNHQYGINANHVISIEVTEEVFSIEEKIDLLDNLKQNINKKIKWF